MFSFTEKNSEKKSKENAQSAVVTSKRRIKVVLEPPGEPLSQCCCVREEWRCFRNFEYLR